MPMSEQPSPGAASPPLRLRRTTPSPSEMERGPGGEAVYPHCLHDSAPGTRPTALVQRAPAKINLALEVLGRRADGYHELVSVAQAIGLYDEVEVAPANRLVFATDRPELAGSDNLVVRAARRLQAATGYQRGARLTLCKRIPVAAGLGGGSSDAAATLVALNQLWELRLSAGDLLALAGELGSDVPFFLSGPTGLMTGRGERVRPLPVPPPLWVVLVRPRAPLATTAVYQALTSEAFTDGITVRHLAATLAARAQPNWGQVLVNGLAPTASRLCALIRPARQALRAAGARYVQMSGSGPTVFALCESKQEANRLAAAVAGPHYDVWAVPCIQTLPTPEPPTHATKRRQ